MHTAPCHRAMLTWGGGGCGFVVTLSWCCFLKVFRAREAPPGLFNYCLPLAEVVPKAIAIASEIAGNTSALSVALCKALMEEGLVCTPEQAMLNESKAMHHLNYTKKEDVKEGIASFLEKRAPRWVANGWKDLPSWLPFRAKIEVRPNTDLASSISSKL